MYYLIRWFNCEKYVVVGSIVASENHQENLGLMPSLQQKFSGFNRHVQTRRRRWVP